MPNVNTSQETNPTFTVQLQQPTQYDLRHAAGMLGSYMGQGILSSWNSTTGTLYNGWNKLSSGAAAAKDATYNAGAAVYNSGAQKLTNAKDGISSRAAAARDAAYNAGAAVYNSGAQKLTNAKDAASATTEAVQKTAQFTGPALNNTWNWLRGNELETAQDDSEVDANIKASNDAARRAQLGTVGAVEIESFPEIIKTATSSAVATAKDSVSSRAAVAKNVASSAVAAGYNSGAQKLTNAKDGIKARAAAARDAARNTALSTIAAGYNATTQTLINTKDGIYSRAARLGNHLIFPQPKDIEESWRLPTVYSDLGVNNPAVVETLYDRSHGFGFDFGFGQPAPLIDVENGDLQFSSSTHTRPVPMLELTVTDESPEPAVTDESAASSDTDKSPAPAVTDESPEPAVTDEKPALIDTDKSPASSDTEEKPEPEVTDEKPALIDTDEQAENTDDLDNTLTTIEAIEAFIRNENALKNRRDIRNAIETLKQQEQSVKKLSESEQDRFNYGIDLFKNALESNEKDKPAAIEALTQHATLLKKSSTLKKVGFALMAAAIAIALVAATIATLGIAAPVSVAVIGTAAVAATSAAGSGASFFAANRTDRTIDAHAQQHDLFRYA